MPELSDICASCGNTFGKHSATRKHCPMVARRFSTTSSFLAVPAAPPTPKKVWLVTTGSYSDYSVYAICETEKLAQELIDTDKSFKIAGDFNDPVEMELWSVLPPIIEHLAREATWRPNADVPEVTRRESKFRFWAGKDFQVTDSPAPLSQARFLRVEGTDPEKVEKVFNDRCGQIIAERMGIA
jgi:hypothetical protein